MCSSYTTKSKTKKEEYQRAYGRNWDPDEVDLSEAYTDESGENTIGFPGNLMPVITIDKPGVVQSYEFGFIPHWIKPEGLEDYRKIHNAKIETIAQLVTWRDAWKQKKRCLVCTNGFFEYDKKLKQKMYFRLKAIENFYYAGIFNNWVNKQTGEVHKTMAIVTTVANPIVGAIHDRMPVIIQPGHEGPWMDTAADQQHLLLQYSQPISATFMEMESVTSKPKKGGQGKLFD